ncbi:hypothetical protein [Nocardia sp. NPDC058666]|uniref:hypothetical protein n=1 Tax=unclassified Nocardia TaxID=2637762 RepID=UPI00365AE59E
MSARYLGKSSTGDHSPTIFVNGENYIIQGWTVSPGDPTRIEIPYQLLAFLLPRTCLGAPLEDTGRGTFILTGEPAVDESVRAQLHTPDNEQCIQVPMGVQIRPDAPATAAAS